MALKWFKGKKKSEAATSTPEEQQEQAPAKDDGASLPATPDAATAPQPPVPEPSPARTAPVPAPAASAPTSTGTGLLARLKRGLTKTRTILTTDIDQLFSGKGHIDDEMLEEIEELLITADIGVQTAMDLMDGIARKASRVQTPDALKQLLKQELQTLLADAAPPAAALREKPHVVMVVGVNGVGKTTTIGKLAAREIHQGRKVLIAAADTFRAAAVEQLAIWAQRAGADLVRHKDQADPAAVAYDGIEAALARGMDTVYVDTAGRLHTKVNLMEEIKKIQRTITKKLPGAPHEILLVLDATTGQNALAQAKMFNESLGVTGLVLTKLDGTAKGGIVISICQQLQLPLHFIGVGEGVDDLQPFDAARFVDALF